MVTSGVLVAVLVVDRVNAPRLLFDGVVVVMFCCCCL